MRVLYVTEMTDAPFRYRVEHAIEQLRQAGHAASTVVPDHPGLPDALPSCDVLVLHRLEWSPRVEVIIEAARRHGVATVFDCDELVFFDGAHPHFYFLGDLSEREQQLYVEMTRNLERTARACGVVLASTPAIADKAAAMGLKTLLHRNVLSAFQERQGLWLGLARRLIPKAPLLGYFSGSHTHDRDLRSIGEPLTTVFERIPEAQLLIVGHMRCPSFAARFPGRVWVAPYLPWREVPAMMARCRALLAPLAELSPFTDAKSALKFFEPGILGVPVVASPTAEMKAAIGDGENGWLAQSPDEWVERLTVALSAHATRRTGARARDTVRAGYTTQAQRGVLAKTLAGLIAGAPARSHGAAELPGHSGKTIERPRALYGRLRHMARYLLKPLYASAQPPPGEMGAFVPPRRDLAAGQARVREDLAERYLSGVGIEVGARQRPLPVPPAAKVRYVDALTKEEAQRRFPELSGMTLVDPEIIDNGQALAAIADGSLDFCIQNHVLEHMRNPVGALRNWLRILKAGGAAYVAVPDRSNTLDRGRPVATLEHLLLDDQQLDRAACDRGHYVEWAVHVNGCERGPAAEARAAELEALDCGIHFHVFDEALFRETLAEACRAQHAEVCEFVRHDELGAAEFIAIVRKLPPPEQLRRPVSIVMPVYNAYEKTVRACETVLQHARDDWELVVVDDASPDQRVAAYLRVLPAREKRVRVLTNGANAGFVITANRGMREARADCDILLLNSDVEVTEGFLRRIQDTAFATADTGVVTPFSNNATIYSVPTAGEDKPLPPGFSADDMQRVVVSGSLRGNPEIPTAVGFCMYIRREVLSRVGLFDEVSYGRGFGEENDLCERAKRAGFKVRLCDSQFIYHAGKSSFGAEGNALSQRHAAILEAKQPGYHAAVARFCAGDPLRRTRLAINAHLRRWPHRHTPAPMFLLHADPFRAAAGGTEAHVLDRVANLGFKRALIVYPNAPDSIEAAEVLDGAVHDPLVFRFPLRHVLMPYAHHDAEAEDILLWITRLFGVRALCFDHLLAWPLHAVRQLHAAGLPYLCVTHDFYAVCPSLNLLNAANWRPCAVHFGGGGDAEACLREHFKAYRMRPPCDFGSLLARHRALFTAILQNAERVVFPSDSSRKTVTDAYPLDASRAVVIPHGYKQSAAIPPRPARGRRLKVALIGAVAFPIKGSDIVVELMRLTTSLPLEWHVFGDADAFDFRARVLRTGARVVFHGAYARENIIPMLVSKGMDAALFTSVCPETFAFTLSEAWCAGVPPIVPRLGALSERVEATGIGWIVEPHSAPAIMKLLQRLAAEPAAVEDMRRKLRSFVHTSVQENAAAYRRLLEPLVNRVASVPEPPSHLLSRAIQRAPVFTGNRT